MWGLATIKIQGPNDINCELLNFFKTVLTSSKLENLIVKYS